MRILIINGPNMKLLGKRETSVYGKESLATIEKLLNDEASKIKETQDMNIQLEFFQSDIEGEIVKKIGQSQNMDGIIINPAAYTHTSVAIHDAISAVSVPVIEVHISNVYKREEFRHRSLISGACVGQIVGFGLNSYVLALHALLKVVEKK